MKLSDVTVEQVKSATNWKLRDSSRSPMERRPERLEIERAMEFEPDDNILYSAVQVTDSGRVYPLLLLKRVGAIEYGGDYFLLRDGEWKRLGEEPEPQPEFSNEYVGEPLSIDPSFDSAGDVLRALYREQFRSWSRHLGSIP